MSNNYEDYGYEEEENTENKNNEKSPIAKKILIIILIIIAILIIFCLIKGCTNRGKNEPNTPKFSYEEALLKAGKTYYENNINEMPNLVGECSKVDLEMLISKGLVKTSDFSTCDAKETYVRVCLLSNGDKHFTPWLTCDDKKSDEEYDESKQGTLEDVVVDSSYIDFKYLPQVIKKGDYELGKVEELWKEEIKYKSYKTLATIPYYKYRDKLYTWNVTTNYYYRVSGETTNQNDVKEYYAVSPSANHKLKDNKTDNAYKWYKEASQRVYALGANGSNAYSPVPIEGYPEHSGGVTKYKTREILSTHDPYLYYECAMEGSSLVKYQQGVKCGEGTDKRFNIQKSIKYSCTSANDETGNSVIKDFVSKDTKCNTYSNWGKTTGTKCDTSKPDICKSLTMYNWYKVDKTYYPSNSNTADKEHTYFTESPKSGYVKDENTKATAYKWYREETKTINEFSVLPPKGYSKAKRTSNYKYTDWSELSTKNPKINDGRDREITTKYKIKLQEMIFNSNNGNWTNLNGNDLPLTLEEMINMFKENKYEVNTLEDINNYGEIRYQTVMFIRNKKEESK